MNNQERYTKENLRNNRPNKLLPIINTVLSLALLGILIWVQVAWNYFKLPLFIILIVLFVVFPIFSWYNSYFSKIKRTKQIYNYDHETKEIVAYLKRFKDFEKIDINRNNKMLVNYQETNEIVNKEVKYIKERCSFGLHHDNAILITLGVSFAGIELDPNTKEVIGLAGVLPKSVWYKKHLTAPIAKPGRITIKTEGFELKEKQIIQALKIHDTYYDNKTGWILIGEKKKTALDEVVEIIPNVYVVIRFNELVSVWIKIEPGYAI